MSKFKKTLFSGEPDDDDCALAERYRTGDQWAMERTFEKYRAEIFVYLGRILQRYPGVGTREQIDDLTEEVFVRAVEKHSGFDPSRGSLKQWLYMLAKTALWNFLRKELKKLRTLRKSKRAPKPVPQPIGKYYDANVQRDVTVYAPGSPDQSIPDSTSRPDVSDSELVERQPSPDCPVDTSLVIKQVLARISKKHYAVILHTIILGFTDTETARILGIPVGTVWRRKSEALSRLRDILEYKKAG